VKQELNTSVWILAQNGGTEGKQDWDHVYYPIYSRPLNEGEQTGRDPTLSNVQVKWDNQKTFNKIHISYSRLWPQVNLSIEKTLGVVSGIMVSSRRGMLLKLRGFA